MIRAMFRELRRQAHEAWEISRTGESVRSINNSDGTNRKVITYSRDKMNQIAMDNFYREAKRREKKEG